MQELSIFSTLLSELPSLIAAALAVKELYICNFLYCVHFHIQVSKDVQKVRNFEASLLRSYQTFLRLLLSFLNPPRPPLHTPQSQQSNPAQQPPATNSPKQPTHLPAKATAALAAACNPANVRVAVKSMCALLVSKPNFNYTLDLL